ncbi:hypothetical protein OG394_03130 [Kribbella sp. NBC_01245]|uniref:hypothetical protein n=1 Tax=Kribbella sp. NBC_01245 TaxID=2903578 RepID=UPI002E2DC362|nr:hypothetical protein [Kribbella sp. NBC_01245]
MSETTCVAPSEARPVGAGWRNWLRHFLEMVAAMVVGMALLDPLWSGIVGDRADARVSAMAVDMAIGMSVWMAYRGHGRRQIVEMAAAMVVPYAVLLVPYWFGWVSGEGLEMGGHSAIMLAMVVVMLVRRREYSAHHHASAHPAIVAVGRRWPTWIALAVTAENWANPWVPNPWVMLGLPIAFVLVGAIRGRLRNPRVLAIQLASGRFAVLASDNQATSTSTTVIPCSDCGRTGRGSAVSLLAQSGTAMIREPHLATSG